MTTAERELDQNTNFDWNRIQESGKELVPVFGPGYTGLVNLGNRYFLDWKNCQGFLLLVDVLFPFHFFCQLLLGSYDANCFLYPFIYFKVDAIDHISFFTCIN